MKFLSVLLLCPGLLFAAAPRIEMGFIVKVYDGDTATLISYTGEVRKIRLAKIDAPELKQEFGKESKLCLADKILNQQVTVQIFNQDLYRRDVGEIFKDGLSVNAQMVIEGCAWVYDAYNADDSFVKAQTQARLLRKGLWVNFDPVSPWMWRKQQKSH